MEHERRPVIDHRQILGAYHQALDAAGQQPTQRNLRRLGQAEARLLAALSLPGKVELGQLVATPGALTAMREAGHIPPEFLLRHKHADWGELDAFDRQQNEAALRHGARLLSAYDTRTGERLWVITEHDRSVTTILRPDEY